MTVMKAKSQYPFVTLWQTITSLWNVLEMILKCSGLDWNREMCFSTCTREQRTEGGCCTTQQVDEGAVVRQALTLKAIWSREMPLSKYILLHCSFCLASVVTFDPYTCLVSPTLVDLRSSFMCSSNMYCQSLRLCPRTHVGNSQAFQCALFRDARQESGPHFESRW